MRYRELIGETIDTKNVDCIINELTSKCQPFLQQIDYQLATYPMFRGDSKDSRMVDGACDDLKITVGKQDNRTPKNTSIEMHNKINKIFTKQFQYPFRNGTFVVGAYISARMYGPVSTIIPIGDFHYLWSNKVCDLYSEYATLELTKAGNAEEITAIFLDGFSNNKYEYQTSNLKQAIKSGNEIMLYCDKVFVVSHLDTNTREAFDVILQSKN